MAEVREDGPLFSRNLRVGEQRSIFGFRDGRAHNGDASGKAVKGAVEEGGVGGAEVVKTTGDTTRLRTGKVRRVRMDAEDHV